MKYTQKENVDNRPRDPHVTLHGIYLSRFALLQPLAYIDCLIQ